MPFLDVYLFDLRGSRKKKILAIFGLSTPYNEYILFCTVNSYAKGSLGKSNKTKMMQKKNKFLISFGTSSRNAPVRKKKSVQKFWSNWTKIRDCHGAVKFQWKMHCKQALSFAVGV